jgi:cell division protein FtsB
MTVGRSPLILIRRAAWPAAGCLVIAYFLGAAIVGENGVLAWGDYRRTKAVESSRLASLEAERARLAHADPDLAEEMVRRELGLVRPDEVIIPMDSPARAQPAAAARP